jgi:hypothetical protein
MFQDDDEPAVKLEESAVKLEVPSDGARPSTSSFWQQAIEFAKKIDAFTVTLKQSPLKTRLGNIATSLRAGVLGHSLLCEVLKQALDGLAS